jgi:putative endonuclease
METITVYALRSLSHHYIYVGQTNNLEKRINEHNNKQNKSTKHYAPFQLLYKEEHPNRTEARIREKFFKSGRGKAFLHSLVPLMV